MKCGVRNVYKWLSRNIRPDYIFNIRLLLTQFLKKLYQKKDAEEKVFATDILSYRVVNTEYGQRKISIIT